MSRLLLFLALAPIVLPSALSAATDPDVLAGLAARPIGPAVMGGRIAALDAVRGDTLEVWVGAAGGGVWKSTDGAITFEPVFDDYIQSIGAIAVDRRDHDTVWVGTGESWVRNSVSIGDGVYRTTDGGETWQHLGLTASERIARIIIDPNDSAKVFVCATGQLWSSNEERGVFATSDGGKTWRKALYVDEHTGCSDIAIDPQDPRILYAGMWQFRRAPWSFESGGPGSGLFRSRDGGLTWEELDSGLPEGDKGRIAVAVAPSRPSTVYAVVEAAKTALYRSDDLGGHFEEVASGMEISLRPFYFAYLVVDPVDHERVYKPGLYLAISADGGRSFTQGGAMHVDLHAMWIDPEDPQEMLVGTDGGLYHSYDRGRTFRHAQALPISQYYQVSADSDFPYQVYGGLQDNGSWMGPSRAPGGITSAAWRNIGYGDGFHVYPDPNDADSVFVEYQGGQVLRFHRGTGEIQEIKPYPGADDPDYRCNWNTPLHVSPSTGALYAGCQFLFRSETGGASWQRISPDLTTNDPEKQLQAMSGGLTVDNTTAENHTTIYTVGESPLDPRVIWAGTDDGQVQLTRDGGVTWTNVVASIAGLPPWSWVSHVEPSPHQAGTAFVTFDRHALGDMAPYLYRTDDFGATWRSLVPATVEEPAPVAPAPTEGPIVANRALAGYAHVVRQDPVNPDLLFVGTELGLFVSIDAGATWARFQGNFPPVAVRDLAIQAREHDLVIGTHGRGVYILDDLTPLRALRPGLLEQPLAVLPSRPAVQLASAQVQSFPGDDQWVGRTLGEVASVFYYQQKRHVFGDMSVEIYDAGGAKVATLPAGTRRGLNRVDWPMRLPPPKMPPATTLARAMFGPRVPEGGYTFRVRKGDDVYEGTLELVADPRSPHSPEDRAVQQGLANDLYRAMEDLTYLVDAVSDLREKILAGLGKDGAAPAATAGSRARRQREDLQRFDEELEGFRSTLVATGPGGMMAGEEKLREQLGNLFGSVAGYDGRPTDSQLERAVVLAARVSNASARFAELAPQVRLDALGAGLPAPLRVLAREDWEQEQSRGGNAGSAPAAARALGVAFALR
jgi:hypothetical protein